MPTEDDFQKQLDANPADHAARLAFADWLAAQGDPRAVGYRALGVLQRYPLQGRDAYAGEWWWHCALSGRLFFHHDLLPRWFTSLPAGPGDEHLWPAPDADMSKPKSRRECEDAAALAFAALPEEHRAEILARP